MAMPEDAQHTLFVFARDVMDQTEAEEEVSGSVEEPLGTVDDLGEQMADLRGRVVSLEAENEKLREHVSLSFISIFVIGLHHKCYMDFVIYSPHFRWHWEFVFVQTERVEAENRHLK